MMPFFLVFIALALGLPLAFIGFGAIDQITSALTTAAIGGILAFAALSIAF